MASQQMEKVKLLYIDSSGSARVSIPGKFITELGWKNNDKVKLVAKKNDNEVCIKFMKD